MKDKLVKGVAWLGAAKIIVNLLALISTLTLAHLLTPEDFGLVALATAMLTVIASFTELSLASALIHHKEPTDEHFNTAWTLNFARSIALGLIFCAIAPFTSRFYNEPRLQNVMFVIGVFVIIMGLNNPKTIILNRNLVFWQEFVMAVSQKLVGFLVNITIAIIFKSYWALVGGMIASQVVGIITSYLIIPFRPKVCFKHAKELWSFSIWLSLVGIIYNLNTKIDQFLIGSHLGPKMLGFYSVGDNLAGMTIREATNPIETVLFPGFKEISNDKERLKQAYLRSQSLTFAIALPIGVGFALISHPLVQLVMGDKWLPVVNVVQVLSCVYAAFAIISPVNALSRSQGETKVIFKRDLICFIIKLPIMIAFMVSWGLIGVLYARIITAIIDIVNNMHFVYCLIGVTLKAQIICNTRSLISILCMVAGVLYLEKILGLNGSRTDLVLKMSIFVLAGAFLYITSCFFLWIKVGRPNGPETEVLRLLTNVISKFKLLSRPRFL